jgi:hypothetical protein
LDPFVKDVYPTAPPKDLAALASVRRQHAGGVDAEHVVEPAEGDPRADAHRQLDDLGVGVGHVHAGPEVLVGVEREVVGREPLGVLGRESLAVRQRGRRGRVLPVLDLAVERLVDRLAPVRQSRQNKQWLTWAMRARADSNSRSVSVLWA